MLTLTLTRPDDWHVHLRDGAMLRAVAPATARVFGRAIVMPNLAVPVTTVALAAAYRERVMSALPDGSRFAPLMTLYLTDQTSAGEIALAARSGFIAGVKFYPAGATTHSASGVTSVERIKPALAAMERYAVPLLVHGEVTDPDVDVFDRERVFLERVLAPLIAAFPALKVVLEHVTTEDGVRFVASGPDTIAATITPQHLMYSRNALFAGGLRPHRYCLPVLKRERHRQALVGAATSGSTKFFLGTDSAPHPARGKEAACGCAGCYTAPIALELYAEVFASRDALDKLEGFASFNGPDFYGLPRNTERISLARDTWSVPESYAVGDDVLVPLNAGETLHWRVLES